MKITVFCFANGNMAVCGKDGQQIPEAQEPWILAVVRNLEKVGLNPLDAEIRMPDGSTARFFSVPDCQSTEYNWHITHK